MLSLKPGNRLGTISSSRGKNPMFAVGISMIDISHAFVDVSISGLGGRVAISGFGLLSK